MSKYTSLFKHMMACIQHEANFMFSELLFLKSLQTGYFTFTFTETGIMSKVQTYPQTCQTMAWERLGYSSGFQLSATFCLFITNFVDFLTDFSANDSILDFGFHMYGGSELSKFLSKYFFYRCKQAKKKKPKQKKLTRSDYFCDFF